MVTIYILKLEHDKYYVGKTTNIFKRLEDHISNSASVWTNTYKPKTIIGIHKNCDDYDEDKFTIRMMADFGIKNVRGGSFVTKKLPEDEINVITKMIRGKSNQCFYCGSDKHFISQCPEKKESDEIIICQDCDKEYDSINSFNTHFCAGLKCTKCGRKGHIKDDCFAKTKITSKS